MSIETSLPYSWLKLLPVEVASLDTIPLWGYPPPFPWENFSKVLGETLRIPHLKITATNIEWKPHADIYQGMGENPVILAFQITPLQGKGALILPREDLKELLNNAVVTSEELSDLENQEWQEEFFEFLALEAIHAFHQVKYDPTLSPQLVKDTKIPETAYLSIDTAISTEKRTYSSRVNFSPELLQSFRQKYAVNSLAYPESVSSNFLVPIQIIAGNVQLTRETWKSLHPGDFLILDSCFLDLDENKGRIVLAVNDIPLFRGKIKDGNIKILEYPALQEVQATMAKDHDSEDESFETDEETFDDEDFTDDEFTEDEFNEDETESSEAPSELESEVASEFEEEEEPALPKSKSTAATPTAVKPQVTQQAPAKSLIKPEEIPLAIAVEVGRVTMSLKQLMDLSPGNILELSVHPENGVDLVVNGRCIGKGELLKIGDALGVRILEKA